MEPIQTDADMVENGDHRDSSPSVSDQEQNSDDFNSIYLKKLKKVVIF